MSRIRRQAVIEAPVQSIWELVGDPRRHPEWYPKVVEVNGERFEEGDQYAQITKDPIGSSRTDFVIERMDDLREIRMVCQTTGMYAHWLLTDAQGGTFVDVEMGMEPRTTSMRMFDAAIGRMYFRRWLEQSLDALRGAANRTPTA
ncbi:MAG TPA: SRPBCC family protein [Solirubrobacterales bacterium]|nr:SRPBCC family protein [Solirubrobacterales bacterium]